jgi:hypothetical protein
MSRRVKDHVDHGASHTVPCQNVSHKPVLALTPRAPIFASVLDNLGGYCKGTRPYSQRRLAGLLRVGRSSCILNGRVRLLLGAYRERRRSKTGINPALTIDVVSKSSIVSALQSGRIVVSSNLR